MNRSLRPRARRRPQSSPRKLPRQDRSRQTVDAILQAATYILTHAGYDGMTTNQIAERAGVNIASLYQYFPNKQAIVRELMQRHVVATRGALAGMLESSRHRTPRDRIRVMVEAMMRVHAIDPKLHEVFTVWGPRLGFGAIHTELDDGIATASQEYVDQMRDRLPDPRLALWVARTAVHAAVHLAFVERPDIATRPELTEELVRLLVPYLDPPAPRRRREVERSRRAGRTRT